MNRIVQYLIAKKSVDDRALNGRVWEALQVALRRKTGPVRILELGGGVGTMLERILERRLCPSLEYRMVEREPAFLAAFRDRLPDWCRERGGTLEPLQDGGMRIAVGGVEAAVAVECGDLHDCGLRASHRRRWDLVMANAVMDLVDMGRVLTGCCRLAGPGGLLHFSINYDGETILAPPWPDGFEACLFEAYHRTMDCRTIGGRPSGASQSGRRLMDAATGHGLVRLAAGRSDWVVEPSGRGYRSGEDVFLERILETIQEAVKGDPGIDPGRLNAWGESRRQALRDASLGFRARNLDVLLEVPSAVMAVGRPSGQAG